MTEQLFYAKKGSEYVNEEVFSGELSLGAKEGDFFFDTRFNAAKIEEIKKKFGNDIEVISVKPEDSQIKAYRKTATIQAEQFDGSAEMIKKYHVRTNEPYLISEDTREYDIVPYQIDTLEGWLNLNIGDWIATGVKGEHWAIADDVFKASYVEVE